MPKTTPTVDDLAELCAALARDEACEIMEEIFVDDLTPCEMVALLTALRPARERQRLAQRQLAPVLTLVLPRQ
jgi:anthranilate phosphoribosyltransferase